MRLIRAKLKGKPADLKEPEPDARQGEVVDLMERLRQSLGGRRGPSKAGRAARPGADGSARSRRRPARSRPRAERCAASPDERAGARDQSWKDSRGGAPREFATASESGASC